MGLFSRIFSRESAAERTQWIEGQLQRVAGQAHLRLIQETRSAQRSFEAAETPAWTESWATHSSPINDDLARQLPTLRSRARGQARNDEWATSYLIKLEDNVLGKAGIRLQMRLKDKAANQLIESVWAAFGKHADVSGLAWRQAERLAVRSLPTAGELAYRMRTGVGPFGFQIQIFDPALVDVTLRREWGGNRVRMGVEIDDDGLPVAYWLLASKAGDQPSDYISVGKHVRVPADQMRLRFHIQEPGQMRGIPWLSVGARRLWMLHDFEQAAAVASSNAAKRQGFFVSPTGEAPPGFADTIISSVLDAAKAAGKVLTPDEIKAITASAEQYATTVPGQYDTLPHGYDFRPYESKWPDVSAEAYVKQHIRAWAAARGMSYVTIGNDLEAVNYSSAQVGIVAERDHFENLQEDLIGWLHADVFAAALPYLILRTPGLKISRLQEYLDAATWQGRRWQPLDPVKAANANEINLRLRLTSRRRILLQAGLDPDEIADEIAEEEKRYGALSQENMPRPKDDEDEDEEEVDGDDKEPDEGGLVAGKKPASPKKAKASASKTDSAAADFKAIVDAYGVGVRAGVFTPQQADELHLRTIGQLPEVSAEVAKDWSAAPVRKPITLAGPDGATSPLASTTDSAGDE